MSFYAYILISEKTGRRYFGSCNDLEIRLSYHNAGKVRSTKAYKPYKVHYFEVFENKTEARKRELFFKSVDGYRYLKEKGII
jgi:putative endonuclease